MEAVTAPGKRDSASSFASPPNAGSSPALLANNLYNTETNSKTMIITRKIEIYVCEPDKELKNDYMKTLWKWRDLVRKAANIIVSHKFVQQSIRDFVYIKDDIKEKFYVSNIIREGKGMSEQNTTYRLLSDMMKGVVPSDIYSSLNQNICKSFKESLPDVLRGEASIRSYKNSIPIPFSSKSFASAFRKGPDGKFYFDLFGIPFCCYLGHDRSNNEVILNRCLAETYKICSSSIAFEKRTNHDTGKRVQKLFLNLCVDLPKEEIPLNKKKYIYAYLDVHHPIKCSYIVNAKQEEDSGIKWYMIGDETEFLNRRLQIQYAVKRCQENNKYATGGHGRKKKLKRIRFFHKLEENYVTTRMHTYSRMLIDYAIKHNAATIILMNQKPREEQAKLENNKENPFLLRNWSYFGLKEKIHYKAQKYGIKIIEDVPPQNKSDDENEYE